MIYSLDMLKFLFTGEISYHECEQSRGNNKKVAVYDGKRLQPFL